MKPRSLFFPLLLVSIGVVLFLVNIGVIQGTSWSILETYWPAVLIIGGLDGLYKRDGWIGPLVLIGFGGVLLAGNLGYLHQGAWELLLRLWPIFLVGIGLDIAFGQGRSTWAALGRAALGLLLVAGIFWLAVLTPTGTAFNPVTINQSLDGATSSTLQLDMAAGEFDMQGGTDKTLLISGSASLPKDQTSNPVYSAPVGGKSSFRLQTSSVPLPFESRSEVWNLKVNPVILLDLTTRMGAGEMKLDLRDTHVTALDSKLGVGQMTVNLPSHLSVSGSLDNAIGEIVLGVPSCADVTINVDRGISDLSLPSGYTNNNGVVRYPAPSGCSANKIDLHLNLAIGSVRIIKLP